jgi:peptidoglycan/LPS O-acetylase OafA/YrhL
MTAKQAEIDDALSGAPDPSQVGLHYRPDIDGLRAVAVIAVVLYHVFPGASLGGFVGVDIFFVISGFLISGIILKELHHGSFSFADFYARRIRRIFPALLVVLTASLAFGWLTLLPNEYTALAKHTVGGAAFVSNLVLWRDVGYFNTAAQSKPLLHLWSLGIEEQFYIGWPFLLVLLWKRTKRVLLAICLLLLLSFFLNVALAYTYPSVTFYFPITRIWELLIGSCLARLTLNGGPLRSPRHPLCNALAVVGSLLIALSLLVINERTVFPGWWALLPTSGTALLISAGPQAWINRMVLASPGFVFVGLISYPLYLWHWPILVYSKLIIDSDFPLSATHLNLFRLGTVALSGSLAWATWRFWETPLRHQGHISRSSKAWGLVAGMGVVTLFGVLSVTRVITSRLNTPSVMRIVQAIGDWDYSSGDNFMKSSFVLHEIRSHSNRETFFAGDSHIEQYWPSAKAVIGNNPHVASAVFATSSGCPPLPELNRDKPGYNCPQFYKWWNTQAHETDVDTVVIGADWEAYVLGGVYPDASEHLQLLSGRGTPASSTDIEKGWDGLESTVISLVQSGKRVFLLSSNPSSPTFEPGVVFHRFRNLEFARLQPIDEAGFNHFIAPIEEKLVQIASSSGATVIRPTEYFCESGLCSATDDRGVPMYSDASHLRPATVIKRATFIDTVLKP